MNALETLKNGMTSGRPDANAAAILAVPKEYRDDVCAFWAFNSHLLHDVIALASRVAVWIESQSLTQPELHSVFARLMRPVACAEQRFPGDLFASLAGEVGIVVAARKARQERERRNAEDAGVRPGMSDDQRQRLADLAGSFDSRKAIHAKV